MILNDVMIIGGQYSKSINEKTKVILKNIHHKNRQEALYKYNK